MKELLLYIARSLVQHPDQVTVTEVETGDELTLELRVAPEDMGRVIGLRTAHRREGFGGYCRLKGRHIPSNRVKLPLRHMAQGEFQYEVWMRSFRKASPILPGRRNGGWS